VKFLNGEQRDGGEIVGHGLPPRIGRERRVSITGRHRTETVIKATMPLPVPELLVKIGQFSENISPKILRRRCDASICNLAAWSALQDHS
jgi:hypothetical protein